MTPRSAARSSTGPTLARVIRQSHKGREPLSHNETAGTGREPVPALTNSLTTTIEHALAPTLDVGWLLAHPVRWAVFLDGYEAGYTAGHAAGWTAARAELLAALVPAAEALADTRPSRVTPVDVLRQHRADMLARGTSRCPAEILASARRSWGLAAVSA